MKARTLVLLTVAAALAWAGSCSSSLGNNLPQKPSPATNANPNLPVGFDIGFVPSAAITEPVVGGAVVPAIGSLAARDVVFVAFSTAADATENDGAGHALSRDAVADGNGASDVFVAALCAQDVERRAFSQSLAGKFRHPRCATCHSMQAPDTNAFVSSPQPHAGPLPGPTFPNNAPQVCAICHVDSTLFPVPGWQAPAMSFDFRHKTVAELMTAAQNIPADQTEHFVRDPRVLWALDSGILPQVNGRNGIADDNQDGVFEPEDIDGRIRTVPGGSPVFIQQILDWRASGMVETAKDAVKDITLVSRATGGTSAGNGAASAPQLVFVRNTSFSAPGTLGTLYVVFQSDATDMVAGDGNGATDVFRTAIDVNVDASGTIDLVVNGDAALCSANSAMPTPTIGNGVSTRPKIGGANGEWVAFESTATNLVAGFTDNNGGAGLDVYVRNLTTGLTFLVSHATSSNTAGGDGSSEAPAIDAIGATVAFESDATNLVAGDTNTSRDVFFTRTDGGTPFVLMRASVSDVGVQGTGGAASEAAVYTSGAGRTLVAFQSDQTDLAAALTAPTNVYLFDSDTGATTLLNQRVAPTGNAIGDGAARHPVIDANGTVVAFDSEARNIDVLRSTDENYAADIFLVETAQVAAGNVLPYRISMTTAEATDANGASSRPSFGCFTDSANYKVGFAAYATAATNLGTSDSTNVVVAFLDETSGVLADFEATPQVGTVPLQVQFTDRSSGMPTGWQWDFDNDATVDATQQNPVATFTTPGLYTVKLTASNANTEGAKTATDFVRARGPVTADFGVSTTSGNLPLTVIFTDASTEAFGTISAWSWDFDNDGTPDSTVQNPSFDYLNEGVYSVTLTVTGEGGNASTTKTNLIDVGPAGPVTAAFTSAQSGYTTDAIVFTDTSIGFVTAWSWDFGDGGTSTLQNPTHTFATAGTYTVELVVSGPGGMDTETKPNWFTSVPAMESVTIEPEKDASIYSESVGNSSGGADQIVAGNAAGPLPATTQVGRRRALLEFDVAGNVPAMSTILSVQLQLTTTFVPTNPTGAQTLALRRVTTEWVEGTNGNSSSPVGIGGGGLEAGNGVTWASASNGSTAWTTAGGDFVATVSASTSVNTPGVYTWGSTATMVSDVSGWLSTPSNNHGWILRSGETSGVRSTKVFRSREDATTADRPKLTITFRRPLP